MEKNTQKEFALKEYTQKEYEADMLKLLRDLEKCIIHGIYTGRIDGKTDDVVLWDDIVEVFGKI